MARTRCRLRFVAAALAAVCVMAASPRAAAAGQDPQGPPPQPPPGRGAVVVERVETGPVFGAEFKFTEIGGETAYLLGGYAGALFDGRLLVGAAGYFQVDRWYHEYDDDYCGYDDDWDDCDGNHYRSANAYGGFLVEWYALRTPAVAVSARGLIGGGVATVDWDNYDVYPDPRGARHGTMYPPPGGYYYYYDQGYFVFEPQLNVSVRVAPGLAVVGGVGYRVIGWANGLEDRIGGLTGTVAVRFGGK
jgi:hypothetical protein